LVSKPRWKARLGSRGMSFAPVGERDFDEQRPRGWVPFRRGTGLGSGMPSSQVHRYIRFPKPKQLQIFLRARLAIPTSHMRFLCRPSDTPEKPWYVDGFDISRKPNRFGLAWLNLGTRQCIQKKSFLACTRIPIIGLVHSISS
jgi:hypothetical protein